MPGTPAGTPPATLHCDPDLTLRAGTSRRRFLSWAGLVTGLAFTPGLLGGAPPAATSPAHSAGVFSLGVASGDPLPDGVVLWTRLVRNPFARLGGMGSRPVRVEWEIAADESMTRVVRRGAAHATAEWGHSIHIDVRGLAPAADYFYRFRALGEISPVGRTRTAPAPHARVGALSIAVASCQNWADGYYHAFADMAAHAPDLVLHLGDYIYEKPIPGDARRGAARPVSAAREAVGLDDYRERYALYKTDPDLQQAHAVSPFVISFDDHEVDNNWAATIPEDKTSLSEFAVRRAGALRAWWENTPVRTTARPDGTFIRAHRRLTFGDLAEINLLDTRSHRSDQVNGDNDCPQNARTADPSRTILGPRQERWLLDGLASSRVRWDVLAQQVPMADLARGESRAVSMDGWSGYESSRRRILDGAAHRGVRNLVSLAGDIHRSVVADLRTDYVDASPTRGVELATTSITSGGDGEDSDGSDRLLKAASPHVRFGNSQRGYLLNRIQHDRWEAEFRVAPSVRSPRGSLRRRAVVTIPDATAEVDVV
ncbi:alkaline phosphatase D family protein [Gordonia amicalis]|uniref:alkaline phosphatase D family protein n=1 Tax=Gordonia amicalis TaxID=89053 RepID=UPI0002A65A94|nr:alkaline phosphatase D family protein [Gordonia amicalis]NKX76386.1 alkaline phosphatase [Gordonia amicalis]GAC51377.1 putative alkaline phosphatase [Gordonia amicalis NBRC 100051 = JCM 11271]